MNPSGATLRNPHDVLDLVDGTARRLAARMLLLDPESAFLRDLVGASRDEPQDRDALLELVARLGREHHEILADPEQRAHPLVVAARELNLSGFELDLLVFAVLPWRDERYRSCFDRLGLLDRQGRPTVGAACTVLLSPADDRAPVRACLARSPLWPARLLTGASEAAAPFEWPLTPSDVLVAALDRRIPRRFRGRPVAVSLPGASDDTHDALRFRPGWAPLIERLASPSSTTPAEIVHVREVAKGDADGLVEILARRRGRACVQLHLPSEGLDDALREASLAGLLAGADVLVRTPRALDALELPEDLHARGLVLIAAAPETHVQGVSARLELPLPTAGEQAELWTHLLGEARGEVDVDLLASRTHLSVASVERAVDTAVHAARRDGREAPEHADIVSALDDLEGAPHSRLAVTSRPRVPWRDLVLDREPKRQLADLVRRVKHRATVQDRWSMASSSGRGDGLVAVLHGESGTGKTHAVDAISTSLGLPLLAVDLSRVVSKYIGESEKHLAELFALADGFRAVLFFDEADALFGKRTGVRDAHDRHANVEVNFLLQRLEGFQGLTLLATNMLQNLDDAFTRRLHFSIQLPRPTPAQQLKIWKRHLPEARLHGAVDLATTVSTFDLVGGEIRNAALTAAYAAAARETSITDPLLRDAIRTELVKRGRPVPRD